MRCLGWMGEEGMCGDGVGMELCSVWGGVDEGEEDGDRFRLGLIGAVPSVARRAVV